MHPAQPIAAALIDRVQSHMTYSDADFQAAQSEFARCYPEYLKTHQLDDLRTQEYSRLDDLQHVYLDYTGGGLYASSQLRQHMEMLLNGVYGNPHSSNPTSLAMTQLDDHARQFIFEYFNASPDDYVVIFTPNASGALKLVGESYPFAKNGQYLLTFDNHNSVNGIREFARHKGVPVTYAPVIPPDLRLDEDELIKCLDKAIPGGNNLFAFPAQSNFSGVQHSLEWIDAAHQRGWDVLVDCAAFAPTNCLDLTRWQPDFVTLSFYKIFGYPTGIGALIAHRRVLSKLHRPWFAGGTITVASVQGDAHYLHEGEAAFEDGTIDYLNLPAVEIGLRHIREVGIEAIHDRVMCLTGYMLDELSKLQHDNGNTLVKIYGPITTENRGGTIAFNLYDPDLNIFDYRLVEGLANEVNISLRTGCFCNPGAGELALNIKGEDIIDCFDDENRMTFEQFAMAMTAHDVEAVGAVRVSVGLATNFADVYKFIRFARTFLNQHSEGMIFD